MLSGQRTTTAGSCYLAADQICPMTTMENEEGQVEFTDIGLAAVVIWHLSAYKIHLAGDWQSVPTYRRSVILAKLPFSSS